MGQSLYCCRGDVIRLQPKHRFKSCVTQQIPPSPLSPHRMRDWAGLLDTLESQRNLITTLYIHFIISPTPSSDSAKTISPTTTHRTNVDKAKIRFSFCSFYCALICKHSRLRDRRVSQVAMVCGAVSWGPLPPRRSLPQQSSPSSHG